MKNPDIGSMYKRGKGQTKKIAKSAKKQVVDGLKAGFKVAQDGLMGVFVADDNKYIIMSEEKVREALGNFQKTGSFQVNLPQELANFHDKHQELMQLMGSLQYEIKDRDQFETDEDHEVHVKMMERNSQIFDEIDQFSFAFSDAMSKDKHLRKKVLEEYEEVKAKYPILETILSGKLQCKLGS